MQFGQRLIRISRPLTGQRMAVETFSEVKGGTLHEALEISAQEKLRPGYSGMSQYFGCFLELLSGPRDDFRGGPFFHDYPRDLSFRSGG